MAGRKERGNLGALESRVMKAVWSLRRATVREVLVALEGRRKLAYTTVLTTLRNLERKGFLRRELLGRSHVYLPAVEQEAVARGALDDLVDRLFDGSRARLVDALIDEERLSDEELADLRRQIKRAERRRRDA